MATPTERSATTLIGLDGGSDRVSPGDLITAGLFNGIVDSIAGIQRKIDGSSLVEVESFLGRPLNDVLFRLRDLQLQSGTVIDTDGQIIGVGDQTAKQRIVIAQMPSPDDRVQQGREVALLVTVPPKTTEASPKIDGIVPKSIALDEGRPKTIAVNGKNLAGVKIAKIDNQKVTFAFAAASGTGANAVPEHLTLDFPDKLPAGEPGSRETRSVPVSVEAGDLRAIDQVDVVGKTAIGKPFIAGARPLAKTLIRITGRNFGDKPGVFIDGERAKVTRASDASIDVTVTSKLRKFLATFDDRTFAKLFPEQDPRADLVAAKRAATEKIATRGKREVDGVLFNPGATGDRNVKAEIVDGQVRVTDESTQPIFTGGLDEGDSVEIVVEANGMQSNTFILALVK